MLVIDVRTAEEYDERHLEDAENISLQDLQNGEMPEYPLMTEIGLYCRSGGRSEIALNILKRNGFTNVKNLGGIEDVV